MTALTTAMTGLSSSLPAGRIGGVVPEAPAVNRVGSIPRRCPACDHPTRRRQTTPRCRACGANTVSPLWKNSEGSAMHGTRRLARAVEQATREHRAQRRAPTPAAVARLTDEPTALRLAP